MKFLPVIAIGSAIIAGCHSSSNDDMESTTGGTVEPIVLKSCDAIDVAQTNMAGSLYSMTLPSTANDNNWVFELVEPQVSAFSAFDSTTGQISFTIPASRLAQNIRYKILDKDNNVVSEHEHRLVYTPLRIMPLGDSITSGVEYFDGVDTPSMALRVGYRKFLYDALTEQGFQIEFEGQGGQRAGADAGLEDPDNNGYPGVDIAFINAKLDAQLSEAAVDVILLHIGTNNTPDNAAQIDVWLGNLDAWELENNAVTALVSTLVPKRDAGLNAVVDQFNTDLKLRLSQRSNDRVVLVDQNAAVSVEDISDEPIGLHPSAIGYEKMAALWEQTLLAEGLLQRCTSP